MIGPLASRSSSSKLHHQMQVWARSRRGDQEQKVVRSASMLRHLEVRSTRLCLPIINPTLLM